LSWTADISDETKETRREQMCPSPIETRRRARFARANHALAWWHGP